MKEYIIAQMKIEISDFPKAERDEKRDELRRLLEIADASGCPICFRGFDENRMCKLAWA